ncbi:unnamed protein product, partial [Aphanomyces euteiches]
SVASRIPIFMADLSDFVVLSDDPGEVLDDELPIPLKLSSLATSSAASERNFSTNVISFIYTKLRSSLSVASVEKLVFIKSNMGAFYDMPVAGYDESDVDVSDQ